jgi:hypothetical protein
MSISHAQVNFFHRANFDTLKYSWSKEVKYFQGKFYVFGGFTRETTVGSNKVYLSKHDLAGNQILLQKVDTLKDSISYYPGLPNATYLDIAGKIYATGSISYEPYRSAGGLYLFDTSGLFNYVINKQDSDIYYQNITGDSQFLYIVGQIADTFYERSDIILSKFDLSLNNIWHRKWGGVDVDDPRGIFMTSGGGVVFGVASGIPYEEQGHVISIDKDGNLLSDRYAANVLGKGYLRILDYNEEKSYYLFKKYFYTNNNQTQIMEVLQTDTGLQLEWRKSWIVENFIPTFSGAYDIWNTVRVPDGHVFCGNKNSGTEGWVFKINDAGDMIWEATYYNLPSIAWPVIGHIFYISGIDTIPNGGFVLSGSTWDSIGRQVAFIMRIDNNGCFSNDSCEAVFYNSITYYPPAVSVKIFPNPVNDFLQIQINNAQLNDAEIIITDVLGQKISNQKIVGEITTLKTNTWANGMYVWAVIEDNKILKSGKVIK